MPFHAGISSDHRGVAIININGTTEQTREDVIVDDGTAEKVSELMMERRTRPHTATDSTHSRSHYSTLLPDLQGMHRNASLAQERYLSLMMHHRIVFLFFRPIPIITGADIFVDLIATE